MLAGSDWWGAYVKVNVPFMSLYADVPAFLKKICALRHPPG